MSAPDEETRASLAAVQQLFDLDVALTVAEIEQALSTIRGVARQALENIADAVGARDFASASIDAIIEATIQLEVAATCRSCS